MVTSISLSQLGWSPFFQQQLTLEEWEATTAVRVTGHHRSHIELMTEQGLVKLPLNPNLPALTVGDWVLLDSEGRFHRMLNRTSVFSRKAAGSKVESQLIAANIDTVLVVCSLNEDFNLSRIERYLALAKEAGSEPVVVLTKADCCDDPSAFVQQVQALDALLMVEAINGLDPESTAVLLPYCKSGKSVAVMGSSGVGKSTLVNTLLGESAQSTGGIREDDSKGRHTTTSRSIHFLPSGGIMLDTPGMRELQLAGCEQGVREAFSDISELADLCRFNNCSHQNEPGCAVQAAIGSGDLDQRRLVNYQKLMREQAKNGATLAEKRASDRSFTRYCKTTQKEARKWEKANS